MKTLVVLNAIMLCLLFSQSIMLEAQSKNLSFVPLIKYEKATLSGRIVGMVSGNEGFKSMSLSFSKVVTMDKMDYEIPVKKDGRFSINIPIECICTCKFTSDFFEGLIFLIPGEETKLEISFDQDQKKHIKLSNSLGLTADDAMNIMEVLMEAITQAAKMGNEILTPEIYSQRVINKIHEVQETIDTCTRLSSPAKQIVSSEVKLWCISQLLFTYVDDMDANYMDQHKTDTVPKEFRTQQPGKSYYLVLKFFSLNDPSYLTANMYPTVLQSLLNNKTLDIPAIGDMPIDKWLIKVKEILKDDIGSETGLVYDLLVSHAFTKQLNDMKPLSDIQKKNIRFYFVNKSIADILIDENEKVIQLAAKSSKDRIFKIDRSSDKVMDSIISKYKGKVVFVDFWATWCAPCLAALQISESVKREFENNDVAFVYITGPSSPSKAWEQKISGIRGEHYYVTEKEWDNLNKTYNFSGIPHYLIFDKSGIIKHNYHSFMGNENMKKWIRELL